MKSRPLQLIILISTLWLYSSWVSAAVSERGLVGYWSLNEGGGTAVNDHSGNGNRGVLVNGPAWSNGRLGKALSFDGSDDYVNAGDPASLRITGNLTMSAWINTAQVGTGKYIASKYNLTNGYAFVLTGTAPAGRMYLAVVTAGSAATQYTNIIAPVGQWLHLVGVYNASAQTITMYVNGKSDNGTLTGTVPTSIPSTVGMNFNIGTAANGTAPFSGLIDDVRIYNRTLTAAEVKSLYQQGQAKIAGSTERGMVGYWSMNDGAGTVAADFSGNGNRGVLVNGPTWTNGRLGKALSFDGSDDRIDVRNNFNFSSTGTFSASVWARTSSKGVIFVTDSWIASGAQGGWVFYVDGTTGNLKFFGSTGTAGSVIGSTAVNDGNLHHFVMTYNNKTVTFYIDGRQDASGTASAIGSGTMSTATYGTLIGANFNTSNSTFVNFFNGLIDEARVYNRALPAQEVKTLYQQGQTRIQPPPSNRGLIAYYSFNEGGGDKFTDYSGNITTATSTGVAAVNGRLGKAANFDGSTSYVQLPDGKSAFNAIPNTLVFTISAWIKLSSLTARSVIIANAAGTVEKGFAFLYETFGGSFGTKALRLVAFRGVANFTVIDGHSDDNQTINDFQWHHVAVTGNGSSLTFYVDAKAKTTTYNAAFDTLSSGNASNFANIGDVAYFGGHSLYFNGSIDELRVYNRALSAQEVKKLYLAGQTKY